MQKFKSFPDLAKSLSKMKIMDHVRENYNPNTLTGMAITKAICDGVKDVEIAQLITDQLKEDVNGLNGVFPDWLLKKIKETFLT